MNFAIDALRFSEFPMVLFKHSGRADLVFDFELNAGICHGGA